MKKLLVFCALLGGVVLHGQNPLQQLTDSIKANRSLSLSAESDSAMLYYNDKIVGFWKDLLERDGSQAIDYSSLTRFSVVKDRDVTFVTWNLELGAYNNTFYAAVGYRDGRERKSKILLDKGVSPESDQSKVYDNRNWPGAIYYDIQAFKRKNGWSYMLLGWRGENRMERYKIADVFSIANNGINMGLPVFDKEGNYFTRYIVHYPASIAYSMDFNEDKDLIYFNRLAEVDPAKGSALNNLSPTYRFDGFEYKRGRWQFKKDIEVLKPE